MSKALRQPLHSPGPAGWLWLAFRAGGATLVTSVSTIFDALRGSLARECCDRRLTAWSKRVMRAFKVTVDIEGEMPKAEDGRRYILMSNHASHMDIPAIYYAFRGSIRMVAKKELFRIPLFGRGMRAGEFISIDRTNRTQAIADLNHARRKMESGIMLWLAPEGTRSRTGELGPLKKGGFRLALETEAIIVPVWLEGTHEILPPDTLSPKLGGHISVRIGKPVDSREYDVKSRDALADKVRSEMIRLRDRLEEEQHSESPKEPLRSL